VVLIAALTASNLEAQVRTPSGEKFQKTEIKSNN
jgi:hypothetical protein